MTNKNSLVGLLFVAVVFGLTVVNCDTGSNGGGPGGQLTGGDQTTVSKDTISAKWKSKDASSLYSSFEFTKDGNYIVVEKINQQQASVAVNNTTSNLSTVHTGISTMFGFTTDDNDIAAENANQQQARAAIDSPASNLSRVHFGTYTINGNTITLVGFGVIDAISFTSAEFNFSFKVEKSGETFQYKAGKVEDAIKTSSKTDLLCHTWKIVSFSAPNYDPNYYNILDYVDSVLFSKAGTYLVTYKGGTAGLSEWKWVDSKEEEIYYSWNNWKDDWQNDRVTIEELSSSKLKIIERGNEVYELTRQ